MEFKDFLGAFLTEAQTELLRESIRAGKRVHFYGESGSGKSWMREVFSRNGFPQVTEPGMDGFDGACRPFGMPRDIQGITLLETHQSKEMLPIQRNEEPYTGDDIQRWLKTGESNPAKAMTGLLAEQVQLLADWNLDNFRTNPEQTRKNLLTIFKVADYLVEDSFNDCNV